MPQFEWITFTGQPPAIQIILIIVIAYLMGQLGRLLLGMVIRRAVVRLKTDKHKDDLRKRQNTLVSIFGALFTVTVWFVAVFAVLRALNVDLAPLLAGVSIIGVALGFGTQSLVKDVLGGTFIVLENQYRVGDIVNLDGSEGEVENISIRATTLRDADGNVHHIPNGSIQRVINKTMGFSNVNLTLSIPSSANLNKATRLINEVGDQLALDKKWQDRIIEKPRYSTIGAFSNGVLEVKVVGKTQPSQQWPVSAELRKRLLSAFAKAEIEISEITEGGNNGKK